MWACTIYVNTFSPKIDAVPPMVVELLLHGGPSLNGGACHSALTPIQGTQRHRLVIYKPEICFFDWKSRGQPAGSPLPSDSKRIAVTNLICWFESVFSIYLDAILTSLPYARSPIEMSKCCMSVTTARCALWALTILRY